ncbi:MFS transporter [Latilactobacillus curvatus]|uniref:Major facilitator superfamily protein n=1 Tax=Latilactobacillus curvatus JCM 1096 = DSM 20019 TaxID=1293592 RepID=A0AAJ0LH65_LATCU|nr:MFS transporter [Latilactobacillus curvatus]KRK92614.1 major facilitator superfamily protein [Latilactobacillus curvatus JCM 1096 = DSM 20019]MCT3529805.1 MFS transporter [Latilactobacillus curvatus]MDG2988048.1 MFS transporter [Latilactobacillus curvatus]QAS50484.1 MFS transporter [Latilactobacillus curvatus JCM 1096 = DSM 20019]
MMGNLVKKIGVSKDLVFGYVGLILFMFGSTIESSWFSSFLNNQGVTVSAVSLAFTFYGVIVALFSWITSFLVNRYTAKKVMLVGLCLLIITTILLVISIALKNALMITIIYALRGSAYPLFAYSFLILVTLQTESSALGRATSWFWLAFNLGMTIIGPALSVHLLKSISAIYVLIVGCIVAIAGGLTALLLSNEKRNEMDTTVLKEMKTGIYIMMEYPRLFIGMVVKTINNIGQFGFTIMMPIFLIANGYTLVEWSTIWSISYIVNAFAGVFFGMLSDKIGWRKVLVYFSGTITGLSCLLIYFVINFTPKNYLLLLSAFMVFAIGIAAFGPLSALIPEIVPDRKSTAISVLNLGSGLSNFIGPFLVTILFQNFGGDFVLFVFSCLYFLASILSLALKTSRELDVEALSK